MYYILVGRDVVPCNDVLTWATMFENTDRIVRQDDVGVSYVSTVFLGLDHRFGEEGPPLLFETMVFLNGRTFSDSYCEHTSTWNQAEAAHFAAVQWTRRQQGLKLRLRVLWENIRGGLWQTRRARRLRRK